ncbi:MAG: D-glycero-beta-D-manno-heptose 1-phosphate adenylyltransferase [Alphaproteobacteria bacterium]|nr:D-glycero-beta-D-manno-heptose 1-phosphate adenylyltransferase [Alphaproteobacteria bacterium]
MIKVLTNGVFDVVHRGHLELLQFCKTQGQYLIVAIDSDKRVKQIKGENRPINNQEDRKFLLESIKWVDQVIIFDSEEELKQLHSKIIPYVYVKGSEYSEEDLRIKNGVCPQTKILTYNMVDSYSTTNIIKKIQSMSSHLKEPR